MITLNLGDKDYPPLLKEIQNPPSALYIQTSLNITKLFNKKAIAIVGSRNMTVYGREVTQKFTRELVNLGFTIISGLARGIDYIAHQTALKEKGATIAVLGCGLDRIYPANHARIANEIVNNGALITEFPEGTQIFPSNFPRRNRIISGLSLGVLVTEASEKSGSLITARLAAEQGREVFAVPGPITSIYSGGVTSLIKKGAKPVNTIDDIIEELQA